MLMSECVEALARRWKQELVVCTLGTATQEWYGRTRDDRAFHMHAMGIAASFGLGLALARPRSPVWLFDSDGGLSMSLGCLLAEARHKPDNLIHFVVDNGCYQIIGGYPIVNSDLTDFARIAEGAGIRNSYVFQEFSDFERNIGQILAAGKHSFVVLKVEAVPGPKVAVPFEGPEIKYRFARLMAEQEGVQVLGPYGY